MGGRSAKAAIVRAAALGLMAVALPAGQAAGASSSQASLAGTWIVNPDESDDPREKIETALQSERRGRRERSPEPESDPNLFLSRVRSLERLVDSLSGAADELTIDVARGEVQIASPGAGRVRIFYLDGETHVRQTPEGSQLETRASWNGRELRIEQDAGDGDTVHEVYALGSDPSVLVVDFRLKLDRLEEPIVIRTLYDRTD